MPFTIMGSVGRWDKGASNDAADVTTIQTLLTAAVADCLVLTFRAVAKASKLEWTSLRLEVEGTLDRADGVMRFVKFTTRATLKVPAGVEEARAQRVLEKAERGCIISASLKAEGSLEAAIVVG